MGEQESRPFLIGKNTSRFFRAGIDEQPNLDEWPASVSNRRQLKLAILCLLRQLGFSGEGDFGPCLSDRSIDYFESQSVKGHAARSESAPIFLPYFSLLRSANAL